MIKDWNKNEVKRNEVFVFSHSLRPFIGVENSRGDDLFIDLDNGIAYTLDELEWDELRFFRIEENPDFLGVNVIDKLPY